MFDPDIWTNISDQYRSRVSHRCFFSVSKAPGVLKTDKFLLPKADTDLDDKAVDKRPGYNTTSSLWTLTKKRKLNTFILTNKTTRSYLIFQNKTSWYRADNYHLFFFFLTGPPVLLSAESAAAFSSWWITRADNDTRLHQRCLHCSIMTEGPAGSDG